MAGKNAFRWTRILGTIGYAIPLVTGLVPGTPGIPIPSSFMKILVPMLNFPNLSVYPNWPAVLLFYGPVNALLYGIIGLIIGAAIRYSE